MADDGATPDDKAAAAADPKGNTELRKELLHVSFLNSLRNRNPGAMQVCLLYAHRRTCIIYIHFAI